MAITTQIVEEKEFSRVNNGYNPDEVDDFLDEILDYMDEQDAEMSKLRAQLAQAQQTQQTQQIPAQPVVAPANDLESASILLRNAQTVYEQTIRDAKQQAEKMLIDAQQQAEQIVIDAKDEIKSLTEQLQTLRSAALDYRARFLRLVEDQQHVLGAESELFKRG
jgi:cell division initiation protein